MKHVISCDEKPVVDTKPDVTPSTPPRKKSKTASGTPTPSSPARGGLSSELRQAIYLDIFTAGIAALGGSGALAAKVSRPDDSTCHKSRRLTRSLCSTGLTRTGWDMPFKPAGRVTFETSCGLRQGSD